MKSTPMNAKATFTTMLGVNFSELRRTAHKKTVKIGPQFKKMVTRVMGKTLRQTCTRIVTTMIWPIAIPHFN